MKCDLLKIAAMFITSVIAFQSYATKHVSIAVYEDHDKYIASSGPYGVSWKLIELAAKSQQIILDPQPMSWEGGINRLKTAKVDLVFPAFKTTERQTWGLFTLPLLPTGSAIYTELDNSIKEISQIDFENVLVGVSANSVQEGMAREIGFKHIYATNDRSQLYSMLQEQRINYVFFATAAVNYYCVYKSSMGNRNCLKQVGLPFAIKSAHAISINSAKSKHIMDALNTGILAIRDSQEVTKLFTQYQYSEQDIKTWQASLGSQ